MNNLEGVPHKRLSAPVLIALHLAPGLAFASFFFPLSWLFVRYGVNGFLALLIAIPICLAPVELGLLFWLRARGAKRTGLFEEIGYQERGTAVEYAAVPILLFLLSAVLPLLVHPLSQYLDVHLATWLPSWATQEALFEGLLSSSPIQQSITILLAVVFSGFVAPIVEELYFRRFLLSRMEHYGWMAPLFNSFLFACYHFYFPGSVPGIFVAFLPVSYVVMVKRNWRLGLLAHCMFNLWGVYSLASALN